MLATLPYPPPFPPTSTNTVHCTQILVSVVVARNDCVVSELLKRITHIMYLVSVLCSVLLQFCASCELYIVSYTTTEDHSALYTRHCCTTYYAGSVRVCRPSVSSSVCLSRRHTHRDSPGAACDAASVHFGPTIRRTNILVDCVKVGIFTSAFRPTQAHILSRYETVPDHLQWQSLRLGR